MTEVKIPKELAEKATDCAEERGFENIEKFVEKAVWDSINFDSVLTEEARIPESNEGEFVSLEEMKNRLE